MFLLHSKKAAFMFNGKKRFDDSKQHLVYIWTCLHRHPNSPVLIPPDQHFVIFYFNSCMQVVPWFLFLLFLFKIKAYISLLEDTFSCHAGQKTYCVTRNCISKN